MPAFMKSMIGLESMSCLTRCSRFCPLGAAVLCSDAPLLTACRGAMLPALLEAASDCGQCLCTILVTDAASAPSTLSTTLPFCSCSGWPVLAAAGKGLHQPERRRWGQCLSLGSNINSRAHLDDKEVWHNCHPVPIRNVWHFLCFHLYAAEQLQSLMPLAQGHSLLEILLHLNNHTRMKAVCGLSFASSAKTSSSCLQG